MFFFLSLTVTLLLTKRHPTMWTLCSSLKNRPAVPWLRRQLSYPLYPLFLGWIAPFRSWPTQTAPAASCLRCDQSGATISCGARVLSSLPFPLSSTMICFCCTSRLVCHWVREIRSLQGVLDGGESAGPIMVSAYCQVTLCAAFASSDSPYQRLLCCFALGVGAEG